jgi:hypothetical protein
VRTWVTPSGRHRSMAWIRRTMAEGQSEAVIRVRAMCGALMEAKTAPVVEGEVDDVYDVNQFVNEFVKL